MMERDCQISGFPALRLQGESVLQRLSLEPFFLPVSHDRLAAGCSVNVALSGFGPAARWWQSSQ